ncbi:glycosyltransferase [Paenibacillus sp. J2TS4]|uniref:glycosyltransferase n=1 Tax=Paenibacillus sp. J2TS4 TaxID=2807194 RepID=UPI001B18169C|nr:glycosyltransferase [Paenibacillus sp. J2TS4]GIP36200.1 putative glycosyl transferase [Paenibacillus sp. J2TS4]
MKVAYLDHTARWSGAEVALYNLLTNLQGIGASIDPIVILAEEGPLKERLAEKGIDVRILPLDPAIRDRNRHAVSSGLFRSVFETMRYSRRLARLLKEEKVDFVHTNSLKAALYGAVAAKLARLPLVWHIHDQIQAPYLKSYVAKFIQRLARMFPNGVIANSRSTLATLCLPSAGRHKELVLYPAYAGRFGREEVVKEEQEAIPEEWSRNEGDFVVLMAGRIDEWKGHRTLLQAARLLRDKPNIKFWIAGDALFGQDDYKQSLLDWIKQEQLTNVTMLGHVDRMERLMVEADLLVHASVMPEPFGQVIVEGMALGLPVIASNTGGPQEIVEIGETGLLIPPGDPDVLSEAIQWMMNSPERRRLMGEGGIKRVREHFAIGQSIRALVQFYPELLPRKKSAFTVRAEGKYVENCDRP